MTTTNFPWDDSELVAPPTIHHLSVGGRSLLFCETRQLLYGLNATAEQIWRSLAEGRPPVEAQRQLAELGVPSDEARAFVEDAAGSWINDGQLMPRDVVAQLSQAPRHTRKLRIHELTVAIEFFGDVAVGEVDAVFGQFAADTASPGLRIAIVSCRNRIFSFEGARLLGSYGPEELIPHLKAVLTERYTSCARDGFLIHAAFLVREDKGILLSGAPGAGKTTLCVALAQSGFEYHGDDIVRLDSDGKAVGTPFAACVKSPAWPLVEAYAPEIATLPAYRRGDGRDVKYMRMPLGDQRPRSIDFVLLLSRQQDASAALEPVEPLEAFSVLLESAYSIRGSITAPLLKTFASAMESARSFRFVYSSLPQAIRLVRELT